MDYKEVVKNILPNGFLDYFEVKGMQEISSNGKQEGSFIITLEETNTLPARFSENPKSFQMEIPLNNYYQEAGI